MTSRTAAEWETRFRAWAGGPGDTELERCENAERMIRKAIAASEALKDLDIEVFAQGSYKNVTNIPQESDVDVSACLCGPFFYEIPDGTKMSDFKIVPTEYSYDTYRQDVIDAISTYFGEDNVTPGNKAIRIHSNSYRVNADVVPSWEYREYYDVANPTWRRTGVKFISKDGKTITNYPKQHIESGIAKNENTKKRFKRLARILKSLQVEMLDEKILTKRLPSFFIESLVYNVEDHYFGAESYRSDVREVLAQIFNNTRPLGDCSKWFEVNGIKFLSHPSQPWSKEDAFVFADAAWNYLGLE